DTEHIKTLARQRGAAEACWAHNPEVGGSKPPAAITIAFLTRGAAEACWAHNPEVGGSKPLAAITISFLTITELHS
uniref:SCP domain-containing protein n=1 Tax=Ascaris lumbricoides TaxID=6252 RepID=A0A0M3I2F8_ASCLU